SVFTLDAVLESMFFLRPGANLVLWSLHVEFSCCLAFPLLFWMSRRMGLLGNIAVLGALTGLMFVPFDIGPPLFLQFIAFFQVGILVHLADQRWPAFARGRLAPILVLFAAVAYVWAPQIAAGTDRNMNYNQWANWMWLEIPSCFFLIWYVAHRATGLV